MKKKYYFIAFICGCLACSKTNTSSNQAVLGKWAIRRHYIKSVAYYVNSPTGSQGLGVYVDSGVYLGDSFSVVFNASGNYTLNYPAGISVTPNSAYTVFWTENGTFINQGNLLTLTTARTAKLWQLLYGLGDTAVAPLALQRLGSDTLLIASGWGVPGVIPYYFDSTLLLKVR